MTFWQVVFGCLAPIIAVLLARDLWRGATRWRGVLVHRKDNPVRYWFIVTSNLGLTLIMFWIVLGNRR